MMQTMAQRDSSSPTSVRVTLHSGSGVPPRRYPQHISIAIRELKLKDCNDSRDAEDRS